MWPDNETADDLFGFQVHADLIRAVVLNRKMLPVTVGVFGDWGGGKTSIMRMLEHSLSPESWDEGSLGAIQCKKTAVVYINTWQFEGYDDAKAAILSAVLLQLHENKRFGAAVRDRALKLLKGINVMRLVRLSLKYGALPAAAAAATGGLAAVPAAILAATGLSQFLAADEKAAGTTTERPSLEDVSGVWQGLPHDEAIDVRTFQKDFAELLKDATIETLVVLIDDLDRCSPERIVENLEAVKLFLSVKNTAFVIGADRRIVEHAIRSRYARPASDDTDDARRASALEAEDRLVRDYLEKLVQVPYTIPRLSAAEIETYMTLLFCGANLEEGDARTCVQAAHEARRTNRYGAFGFGGVKAALSGDVPKTLTSHLALSLAASPLMADGLKGNPRQVKRFLNALMLRRELASVAGLENAIETNKLVKLMILEYVEPDLFVDLFGQIDADGRAALLDALESQARKGGKGKVKEPPNDLLPGWSKAWTTRWAAMEPSLADTDLRDYFWVSRDRLESTFSGITMVPPIVRAVVGDFATGLVPKRQQAVATARGLGADERAAMYKLLEQEIAARPAEPKSYEPLRALAEADIEGAAATLTRVLTTNPAADMPAAVGMWIVTLHQNKPTYRTLLGQAIEQLRGTDTTIGKAIKAANG
jgi:hypothetical protein